MRNAGTTLEGTEPPAQRVRLDGGAVSLGADPALVDVGGTEGEPLREDGNRNPRGWISPPTPRGFLKILWVMPLTLWFRFNEVAA